MKVQNLIYGQQNDYAMEDGMLGKKLSQEEFVGEFSDLIKGAGPMVAYDQFYFKPTH